MTVAASVRHHRHLLAREFITQLGADELYAGVLEYQAAVSCDAGAP